MTESYLSHIKQNFKLAYPVMIGHLGHVAVGLADSVMSGQLGTVELAACSLANSIFFVFFTFGMGASYAMTPLVASANGQNNPKLISSWLKHGTLIYIVLGGVLIIPFYGDFIIPLLNSPAEVASAARPYLMVLASSIFPLMLFQAFRQFAEGLSQTKQAMYITLACNGLNILLNYILMFGKLGMPEMGLVGAGVATLISRIFMGIAMFVYIRYHKQYAVYWQYWTKISWQKSYAKKLLSIGIPTGVQFVFEVGAFGFATVMMGWISKEALAAHQIALNLASMSFVLSMGISAAATIRVGNHQGSGKLAELQRTGFASMLLGLVIMSISAGIFIMGRTYLPSLYVDDPMVIPIAAQMLIIAGLFQLSDGIQVISMGALRGMTDVKVPTAIAFLAYWAVGLPFGYVLGFVFGYGANGIWVGLLTGLTFAACALFGRFYYLSRNKIQKQHATSTIASFS